MGYDDRQGKMKMVCFSDDSIILPEKWIVTRSVRDRLPSSIRCLNHKPKSEPCDNRPGQGYALSNEVSRNENPGVEGVPFGLGWTEKSHATDCDNLSEKKAGWFLSR